MARLRALAALLLLLLPAAALATRPPSAPEVRGWAARADALQRRLGRTLPLPHHTLQGTHNSYNYDDRASPSLQNPKNQLFTLGEQLRVLGARTVEVDLHFVTGLPSATVWDRVRVCHASPSWARRLLDLCTPPAGGWLGTCSDLGIEDLGNQTGCVASSRTANETLAEVREFLDEPANADEFLVLYLEHYMDGRRDLLDALLEGTFGDLLVPYDAALAAGAPSNAAAWPSVEELVARGQRVMVFSSAGDPADPGPAPLMWPQALRQRGSVPDFDGVSCATLSRGEPVGPGSFFTYLKGDTTLTRLPDGTVVEDGSEGGENVIDAGVTAAARACGFNPAFDLHNATLFEAQVWSWDEGHPAGEGELCGALWLIDGLGRFRSVDCGARYPVACRRDDDWLDWVVPEAAAEHPAGAGAGAGAGSLCPSGYSFAAPRHPRESHALMDAAAHAELPPPAVWLPLRSNETGCWAGPAGLAPRGATRYCPPTSAAMGGEEPASEGSHRDNGVSSAVVAVVVVSVLVACAALCFVFLKKRGRRHGPGASGVAYREGLGSGGGGTVHDDQGISLGASAAH